MKKLLFILSFLFAFIGSYSQVFVTRTTGSTTPVDMRLKAGWNLYIPTPNDTTLNGGIDSVGMILYAKNYKSFFIRDSVVGGGRKWTKILKTGDAVLYSDTTAMLAPYLRKSLLDGHIFVGNASNIATDVAMTGVLAITNTGVTSLSNSGVTAGSYTNSNITIGADGRITAAANGSSGTGSTNSNVGSGFRWAVSGTNNIKTLFTNLTLLTDSSSNTNGLTLKVDTTFMSTRAWRQKGTDSLGAIKLTNTLSSGNIFVGNGSNIATSVTMSGDAMLNNAGALTLAGVISAGSCTNCNLTYDAKGRITVAANGSGGSGGVTTMQPIGSSPNDSGATISGVNLTLQPANASFGGVVTTDTQSIAGNKHILGKGTDFNGFSPLVNSQWLPSAKDADSIYISGKYLGFGFPVQFKSGVRAIIYVKADNHVGGSSIVMIGRSYDQGRTYTSDTLINQLPDTLTTLGGGGLGPNNRLIVFYKRFRFSSPTFFPIDQKIIYSDDEGSTFSTPQTINNGGNDEYLPYGGLVRCANDELLLSWYGQTGSTYNSYVIKSTNGGTTWGSPITVFSNTASQRTETTFEHLGGGVIIGLMRSEVNDTLYGQVISYDNGATWGYQGQTTFGIKGTPAWLNAFKSQNGKMAVVAYYRVGTDLRAIYGYADSVILGPTHWNLNSEVTIATGVDGSGYLAVCHPYQEMFGWGFYYDETVAQARATIKFVKTPIGSGFPIGASSTISGLTTNRLIFATSATSIGDNNKFKVDATAGSIILNGATGSAWSGHDAGVIDGGKSSILFPTAGNIQLLNNAYLNTDYRYFANGPSALFYSYLGAYHFLTAPSGTAGDVISYSEKFGITNVGEWNINGSVGSDGQVPRSNGPGLGVSWYSFVSSPWVENGGGNGINYGGSENVGIHTTTPFSPLTINAATTSGKYTQTIIDNNSLLGSSLALNYSGGSTGQKTRVQWVDGNGHNWGTGPDNPATGGATLQMNLSPTGELHIGNDADAGAFTLQNYGGLYEGGKSRFTDTAALDARFGYTGNYHASFTQFSLTDKKYVDSLIAAGGGGDSTIVYAPLQVYAGSGSNPDTIGIAGLTTIGTAGQAIRINAGATGFEYYTPATGTVTSVSGTTNRITSTGGATPVIDISSNYVGQSSIITVGTLTGGATGSGFTVALGTSTITGNLATTNGGTGQNSYTNGQLLIGNTTGNTLTKGSLTSTSGTITWTVGGGTINGEVSSTYITSGTYTATLTNGTNVASSSFVNAHYYKIGDYCNVWISLTIDPTSVGATALGISFPFASAIVTGDVIGHGNCASIAGQTVVIASDAPNSRANLSFTASDINSQTYYISFSYLITPP